MSFWKDLKKPIIVLAPMADVTDMAFREMFVKYGSPSVYWTEFVSADGLLNEKGRENLMLDLKFSKKQFPIVAQIFSSKKENIKKVSILVKELGFQGVDINMGCPDRKIEKQLCGASLIKNKELAVSLIEGAKESGLPVSVKTRIGYNEDEIDVWIRELLKTKIDCLTIHLRTRKDMSLVDAKWEKMQQIIKLRDEISPETLIIGNGDVKTKEEAIEKLKEYKCDGVMIGRGIFGNPWVFNTEVKKENLKIDEILNALIEHTYLYEKYIKGSKSFSVMKKHFKAYVNGFDGAQKLREELMNSEDAVSVERIIKKFLKEYNNI